MPRSKRKKRTHTPSAKDASASPPLDPLRTGMPALDSIVGVTKLRKGTKKMYQFILTNEVDEYEQVPSKLKRKKNG